MDSEPVIAKILITEDPFWVAKWQHEIDIYRSFERERPPVRIPQLKWTNGLNALILEWIGGPPADEGRYLSRPLDPGDISALVAAVQAISTWQPTVPGSPALRVMVDYRRRIERYHRRGFFTAADSGALTQLLDRAATGVSSATATCSRPTSCSVLGTPARWWTGSSAGSTCRGMTWRRCTCSSAVPPR